MSKTCKSVREHHRKAKITECPNVSLQACQSGLFCTCILLATTPLTAGAAGLLHADPERLVLRSEPVVSTAHFPTSEYLTGNWGGARDQLREKGVDIELNYTTEPMYNVSGGEKTGGTYLHNIDLDLKFDLDKIFGGGNTTFLAKVSQRSGRSVSERYVAPSEGGNQFTVQEAFGDQIVKLVNAQFNTRFLDDRLDLAYGRIVANDDFLRSPSYCQFINNSFCGSPQAVFLQTPFAFTAYPTAAWGMRSRYDTASRNWTFQGAIYDADPNLTDGNPASDGNPHGTNLSFGDNGVTLVGEVHFHRNRDSTEALPGVYKIGGFYMNGDYEDISKTDNSTTEENAMFWLLADQALYREAPGSDQGLSGFGALVFSLKDKVNTLNSYFNAGFLYKGLFGGRPKDVTGVAFTTGWFSDELNVARESEGKKDKDYEAVIEVNHKFVLTRGIAITPNIQYVIRPAGTGDIDDALLLGGRLSVQF
jgi:porin